MGDKKLESEGKSDQIKGKVQNIGAELPHDAHT